MAALDDLLEWLWDNPLRVALERELEPLRSEQQLGLVFERHIPEKVRLYDLLVRRGATVESKRTRHPPHGSSSTSKTAPPIRTGTLTSDTHPMDEAQS